MACRSGLPRLHAGCSTAGSACKATTYRTQIFCRAALRGLMHVLDKKLTAAGLKSRVSRRTAHLVFDLEQVLAGERLLRRRSPTAPCAPARAASPQTPPPACEGEATRFDTCSDWQVCPACQTSWQGCGNVQPTQMLFAPAACLYRDARRAHCALVSAWCPVDHGATEKECTCRRAPLP